MSSWLVTYRDADDQVQMVRVDEGDIIPPSLEPFRVIVRVAEDHVVWIPWERVLFIEEGGETTVETTEGGETDDED